MRRKIHIVIILLFIITVPIGNWYQLKKEKENACHYCCSAFEGKIDRLEIKHRDFTNVHIDGKWVKLTINVDSDRLKINRNIVKVSGECRTYIIENGKKIDITSGAMLNHIENECICE